jgi:hypothetical protein
MGALHPPSVSFASLPCSQATAGMISVFCTLPIAGPATLQKTKANPVTSRMPKPIIAKLIGSKAGVLNIENTPRLSAR